MGSRALNFVHIVIALSLLIVSITYKLNDFLLQLVDTLPTQSEASKRNERSSLPANESKFSVVSLSARHVNETNILKQRANASLLNLSYTLIADAETTRLAKVLLKKGTLEVDHLLDFAIIGFPKTGTTTLMNFFAMQPEFRIHNKEVHFLTKHEPLKLVEYLLLLRKNVDSVSYKYGYKAPRDIMDVQALDLLGKYWPSTKFIVGLRHPVHWFQSFYNYRYLQKGSLPPPHLLIGESLRDIPTISEKRKVMAMRNNLNDRGVTTDSARFHVSLSWLGKTNISDPSEDALLGPRRQIMPFQNPLPNKIFLYDSQQLEDQELNNTRFQIFMTDLANFFGVTPMAHPPPNRTSYEANYNPNRNYPLDICNNEHTKLRKILVEIGTAASQWIVKYFMINPDVTVSSPDNFRDILKCWQSDPCLQTDTQDMF